MMHYILFESQNKCYFLLQSVLYFLSLTLSAQEALNNLRWIYFWAWNKEMDKMLIIIFLEIMQSYEIIQHFNIYISPSFFTSRGVFSLGVQSLDIESLGLRSLRRVSGGLVLIHNNSKLCYTSSLPWASLLYTSQELNLISNNNRDPKTCGNTHTHQTLSHTVAVSFSEYSV